MKQPLPDEALDDRLFFGGTAGSGKTYNAMGRVERLLDRKARAVIPDPLGVWWGLRQMASGQPGYDVVIFGGPHGDLPLNEFAGALIGETVAGMKESCILDLSELGTKAAERRFMLAFLTALYRGTAGEPLHVVFDEADMWAPERLLDKEGEAAKLLGMMETLVRRGRVKGFIPWLISQRPAVVSKNVLSQVDGMVIFKLTSSQDRDAIGNWVEGQADKATWRQMYGDLATMERGHGVVWLPARGILETVRFPPKHTLDSSRTPKRGEKVIRTELKAIDLGALKERLGKVEAEVKANDPKALKARIRELEAEVARKPGAAVDQTAIEAARQAGYADGWRSARDAAAETIKSALTNASYADGRLSNIIVVAEEARGATKHLISILEAGPPKMPAGTSSPAPTTTGVAHRQAAYTPEPRRPPPIEKVIAEGISRPQQRILDALAWLEWVGSTGVDRVRVAMLADQSPKSSGFRANLSTLSGRELLTYGGNGGLNLTEAGRATANKPQGAPTNAELHDAIRAKISGPQWKMLAALIGAYPRDVARDALAAASDQSLSSSGFRANLSTLSGLGFIEYRKDGSGNVAATRILFVER